MGHENSWKFLLRVSVLSIILFVLPSLVFLCIDGCLRNNLILETLNRIELHISRLNDGCNDIIPIIQ